MGSQVWQLTDLIHQPKFFQKQFHETCFFSFVLERNNTELLIQVSGDDVPSAIRSFEESGLRDLICENIKKAKYTIPTPVQKHAIPIIMKKRDLMACAQTGSGKTVSNTLVCFKQHIYYSSPVFSDVLFSNYQINSKEF